MSSLSSIFFGVPQSRYAAIAILIAIIVVSLVIVFGKDSIPMSQKFGFVLLITLISLPSLAMSLFQITCLVTGAGFKNQRPWCGLYAWLLSAIMIFYSIVLVVAAVMSLAAPAPGTEGFDGEKGKEMKKENKEKEKELFNDKKKEAADKIAAAAFTDMPQAGGAAGPSGPQAGGAGGPGPARPTGPMPPSTFGVNGDSSLPAPATGNDVATLPPAPTGMGPMPSSPETFTGVYSSLF